MFDKRYLYTFYLWLVNLLAASFATLILTLIHGDLPPYYFITIPLTATIVTAIIYIINEKFRK